MADPDTFRVSPSLRGLPELAAPAPENASPRQMIALGESVQRAGGVAGQIQQDVLQEQNATRTTEALTQFTEYLHERTYGEDGWANLKGKNALDRGTDKSLDIEVGDDLQERAEQLALGLGNDAQRRAFRERAMGAVSSTRGKVQEHLAKESFTYRQEVLTGTGDSNLRMMALTDDPAEMIRHRDVARDAYGRLADMRGIAPEARDEFLQEALTPGHVQAVERFLAADAIDAAEKYVEQFRDDLTLKAAGAIESRLIEQRTIVDGYNIGEAAVGVAAATNEAAAPQQVLMPVVGLHRKTGGFGDDRGTHRHGGIDTAMPIGTAVRAGAAGTARVKRDPKGYGLYVDLKLDDGTTLRMAHLNETTIKDGDRVSQGQIIAKTGNSGRSSGPHLHYEVIGKDGKKVDPEQWHQGKPTTNVKGQPAGTTWSQVLQNIVSQDLPPQKEKYAIERARTLWTAREEAEQDNEKDLRSSAFAEIDRTGSLSNATRSRLISAGLGDDIPALRSFEKATNDRRKGGTVSESEGLVNYGLARQMIADGSVNTLQDLLPLKPHLPDNLFKQLVDDVTKDLPTARTKADKSISLMNEEIEGSGLFRDKDGKITNDTRKEFSKFVGAVTRQIEGEERVTGKPVDDNRQRQIVLGMLSQQVISSTGDKVPGYQVRKLYDNIPGNERTRAIRALQRRGIAVPSQRQVIDFWQGER